MIQDFKDNLVLNACFENLLGLIPLVYKTYFSWANFHFLSAPSRCKCFHCPQQGPAHAQHGDDQASRGDSIHRSQVFRAHPVVLSTFSALF